MKYRLATLVWMSGFCAPVLGAVLSETFTTDPVINLRFEQITVGTESAFTYDPVSQSLLAVLDVDKDAAWYRSNPFPPFNHASDFSFSFEFKVLTVNTQVVLPYAYVGLMTTKPVTAKGDGVTLVISAEGGVPAAVVNVDEGERNSGGNSIRLETNVNYLVICSYTATDRRFNASLYNGLSFTNFLTNSVAFATNGFGFHVDRFGLMNAGGQNYDYTNGEIRLRVDNFFLPARKPVFLTVTNSNVREVDAGTTYVTFTASLNAPSAHDVQVDFATSDVTATAGIDYRATNGVLTITNGSTSRSLLVPVLGDLLAEPNESFRLTLSNPVNAILATVQTDAVITNDDLSVITIRDAAVAEIPGGTTNAMFQVSLSKPNSETVYINYDTADGTAVAAGDYSPIHAALAIPTNATGGTIQVEVRSDTLNEFDETFLVNLSNPLPTNAVLGDWQATGTIASNDLPPAVRFCSPLLTVAEGRTNITTALFKLCLSSPSGKPVTLCYATEGETAIAGCDFKQTNASVTFPPGTTTQDIPIEVLGDTILEPDERFFLKLTSATNALIEQDQIPCLIFNDDPAPCIRVDPVILAEGHSGVRTAAFNVWLSNPSTSDITVHFTTINSTALATNHDYAATNGTLTFPALGAACAVPRAATNQTIPVTVYSDVTNEPDEIFLLRLDNPVNATLCVAEAACTITNDDFVCVSIGNTEVEEGDTGWTNATFELTLNAPAYREVRVQYRTEDGTARAPGDYQAVTNMVAVFPAGTTRTNISVQVRGDLMDEPVETFKVLLTSAVNAQLCGPTGIASIMDNDPPAISIQNTGVVEGGSGTSVPAFFRLLLSSPSTQNISVQYATTNGSAVAGQDYYPTNGIVTFLTGQTNATVRVTVLGDEVPENNEDFYLKLANPVNATLSTSQASCTITNNGQKPCVSFPTSLTIAEGQCVNIPVSLSRTSSLPVTIRYCLNGAPMGIRLPCDSNCCALVIPPGQTKGAIPLCYQEDATDEPNRTFDLVFSVPDGSATICAGSRLLVEAVDNDPPALYLEDNSVLEGNNGTRTLCLNVRFSTPPETDVTARLSVAGGTAQIDEDFRVTNWTRQFNAGVTTQSICLEIIGDDWVENNETVIVCLTNVIGATVSNACARGTILNDDQACVSITGTSVWEGDAGTTPAIFTVSVLALRRVDIPLDYQVVAGTAANNDFQALSGRLVIQTNVSSTNIVVPIMGDRLDEPDEAFSVRLSLVDPGITCGTQLDATGKILDDDAPEIRVFPPPPVIEPDVGTTNLTFLLSLSNPKSKEVSAEWLTRDSTALAGMDYLRSNGWVRFTNSQTAAAISLKVLADDTPELEENFFLCFTNLVFAHMAANCAEGRILPGMPCIRAADVVAGEGGMAVVNVVLDQPSLLPVTVAFSTSDGIAKAGLDYIPANGILTFSNSITNQMISIPILSETLAEPVEIFYLWLSNPTNANVCTPLLTLSITNDARPTFYVPSEITVPEGDTGFTEAPIWGTMLPPSSQVVTIDYATRNGTATLIDEDYQRTNSTLRMLPGMTNAPPIKVRINGDRKFEPDEFIFVTLTNSPNVQLSTNQVIVHILNDDPPPAAFFLTNTLAMEEGDLQTNFLTFHLLLSRPSAFTTEVHYATLDGTARAGADYIAVHGTNRFAPDQTNQPVTVAVVPDLENEPDESFYLHLTSPDTNLVTIAVDQATGTILNDDDIRIQVESGTFYEPINGLFTAPFQLTLSRRPNSEVRVNYATRNGTAQAGADYVATNGTLIFPTGADQAFVYVPLLSDTNDEPNEIFFIQFANPHHAVLETNLLVGTILDTDPPCISIQDITVVDDGTGTIRAVSSLSLSSATNLPITVTCITSNGTALAGSDYSHATNIVRFSPGQSTAFITNWVYTNTREETNEFFLILLSHPTNATICDPVGVVTIANTNISNQCPHVRLMDLSPGLCLTAPAQVPLQAEASDTDGLLRQVEFFANGSSIARLQPLAGATIHSINWTAIDPGDYTLLAVAEDNLFCRQTSAPVRVTIEQPARLQVGNATVIEGNAGLASALFTVSLQSPTCRTVAVQVVTFDGTARAGSDYQTVSTNLVFRPGSVAQDVMVPILGDRLAEPDETFSVRLANPSNALIALEAGLGMIINDDTNPVVAIIYPTNLMQFSSCEVLPILTHAQAVNGTVGMVELFTNGLPLFVATNHAVLVTNQFDWIHPPEGIYDLLAIVTDNWGAKGTSAPVRVQVVPPPLPHLTIDDVRVDELDGVANQALFTVSLLASNCHPVTVEVITVDGTARAGLDYAPVATNLRFTSNVLSLPIVVPIFSDHEIEPDETFSVVLKNALNAVILKTNGIGTIAGNGGCLLFTTPLENQTACVCGMAEFHTIATGTGPFYYQWSLNDHEIPNATNASLVLPSLKPQDAGIYSVFVYNDCLSTNQSAMLGLTGAGDQNPSSFTNSAPVSIPSEFFATPAQPYPSTIHVQCVPGVIKDLQVHLACLSHNSPKDLDIMLVNPQGLGLKLMSDCGGDEQFRIFCVSLTFSDSANRNFPLWGQILPGVYPPTDFEPEDYWDGPVFNAGLVTNFSAFRGRDANGPWNLYIMDDLGGDVGILEQGWSLSILWEDVRTWLEYPVYLPDGSWQLTLHGLPGFTYEVKSSVDLIHWTSMGFQVLAESTAIFIDPNQPHSKQKFYRAVRCP